MKHDRSYITHEQTRILYDELRIFFTTDSDELTLKEFAQKANVFYGTVWKAINGQPITTESHRRITQAVQGHRDEIQQALEEINGATLTA
jgi:predicted transcriptional regulator